MPTLSFGGAMPVTSSNLAGCNVSAEGLLDVVKFEDCRVDGTFVSCESNFGDAYVISDKTVSS